MKTLAILLVAAAAAFSYLKFGRQAPIVATIGAPQPRLMPAGQYCLVQRASITTSSGVVGFPAGTPVQLVEDRGETMLVSTGESQLEVARDTLTNDLDVAALAAKADAASQQALAQQVEAMKAARVREFADNAKRQDEMAAARKQATATRDSTALNRGAYAEKTDVAKPPKFRYVPAPQGTPGTR